MNFFSQSILTITQVANQVKYALEKDFSNLWIQGEISSFKEYPSGHIYLTLKDNNSELSAVIFSSISQKLKQKPSIGTKVTVSGSLSLYAPKGKFQLIISNLYTVGQGELWLAYEALKHTLEKEGLFSIDKKKSIAKYPRRVGIVTSAKGAVIKDILHVLGRRAPYVGCLLYPVSVQGIEAADQIVEAIEQLNIYGGLDTLILARGGGSIEDLWAFNDEKVVRAIYASNIPIISAIGHETDTTLSDYVADLRAPTPSSAAELVAVDLQESLQKIDYLYDRIYLLCKQKLNSINNIIAGYKARHAFFKPALMIDKWVSQLSAYSMRFHKAIEKKILLKQKHLDKLNDKLSLLNPKSQLNRGYSILLDEKNKVISSIKDVQIDDILKVQLIDGTIKTKVKRKKVYNG